MSGAREVLPVLHPVPTRFVPRRGRHERTAYVQATSPIRLTRIDPGAVGPRHEFEGRYDPKVALAAIEGRPFVRAAEGADPGSFAAYLLRQGRSMRRGALEYAFAGTPLSVLHPFSDASDGGGYVHDSDFRGYAAPVPDDARVTYDGTEGARAALQAFFDRRVRLVGADVWVDTGGPAFGRLWSREGPPGSFRLTAFPNRQRSWDEDETGPYTPAEADGGRAGSPPERRLLAVLPPGADTATTFANRAPGAVFHLLRDALHSGSRPLVTEPALREDVARLRWLALEGSLGLIRPEDAGPAIVHVADMAEWGLGRPRAQEQRDRLRGLLQHCRERVLPRLAGAAAPIGRDDAAAPGGPVP